MVQLTNKFKNVLLRLRETITKVQVQNTSEFFKSCNCLSRAFLLNNSTVLCVTAMIIYLVSLVEAIERSGNNMIQFELDRWTFAQIAHRKGYLIALMIFELFSDIVVCGAMAVQLI